jgi:hypothetical protein
MGLRSCLGTTCSVRPCVHYCSLVFIRVHPSPKIYILCESVTLFHFPHEYLEKWYGSKTECVHTILVQHTCLVVGGVRRLDRSVTPPRYAPQKIFCLYASGFQTTGFQKD